MSQPVFTGAIWHKPKSNRAQIVRRVCEALEREYGRPRLENPIEPLDDLVFIILSNKTSPQIALRTYEKLKIDYPTWDDVLSRPYSALNNILKPAGLENVKSKQIIMALRKIQKDFGICDLSALRGWSEKEAQDYLVALPGVSEKVAKCVMIYTLAMEVLPVDSHVHRVSKRLGWINRKRADQCHDELEALIPPKRRFAFHVDCLMHGRNTCRPKNPACDQCCISRYCDYFQDQSHNE